MKVSSNTPATTTADFSTGVNEGWENASFRSKFGSLFKSDNEKRLAEYAEGDMALVKSRVSNTFSVADAHIQDSREDRSLGMVGTKRTTSAQSVAQSFDKTSGASFKAMMLRA